MKKYTIMILALAGALACAGCQKAAETPFEKTQETESEAPTVWQLTILADRNASDTKGLEIGEGTEATTQELKSVWKTNEPVKVFLGTECIGTLTATPDGTDPRKATLSGSVITTGITPNTTTLTLLAPRDTWDYTGQTGKLLYADDADNSIERKYDYTLAPSVPVTGVSGSAITTENAYFSNQQSIYRLSFRYNDGNSKTPIAAKSVQISSANGHLVQHEVVGGVTTEGDISVTLGTATADPFFVALRNGDQTNEEVLTFTVVDGTGVTYRGTKTIPEEYKPNGTFLSLKNASLNQRLDLSLSATEVTTVL